MVRVAGTDPGTSSLDVLILDDGAVQDQACFPAEQLQAEPSLPVRWLQERGPFDLIAGPSGYGLPLVRAADCGERERALMALVRPDDHGRDQGVRGFGSLLRAFCAAPLPVVFLPGVIHLPTVPPHRKINRIDLGTADKLCVAALALAQHTAGLALDYDHCHVCVVELGTAFTACLALREGRVVDGVGGSSGPAGWRSPGAWDGEVAYLMSPLNKDDLFHGGADSVPDAETGARSFREALVKGVAGLRTMTPFEHVVLSGRLLEVEPALAQAVQNDLAACGTVGRVPPLSGAWVKHAAQGAALLADGLAGGRQAALVERLGLRGAGGTVLDWLTHPRAGLLRAQFAAGAQACAATGPRAF